MISVAIDGPAGAGKSTAARSAARELSYIYVDTGALYRAIGLFALENGVDTKDEPNLKPRLTEINIELKYIEGEQRVLMNGRDVSSDIRRPEMAMAASNVSAMPSVRAFLLDLQRDMAKKQNVIMDGRDIGTVVLPDANVKIFLTASAESRAQRRYEEHLAKMQEVSYNKILEEIQERDYQDSHRDIAPLRQAGDAILLDTTEFSPEKTLKRVVEIIRERI